MNSFQAKNLNFPDLLARLGHHPVEIRKGGDELWYRSPFRKETEASFHISKGYKWAWVWKDFGDEGGTVIDFIMRYHHHRDLRKALQFLKELYQGRRTDQNAQPAVSHRKQAQSLSSHPQAAAKPSQTSEMGGLKFLSAQPISNPLIYSYLKGRGIEKALADRYLLEITYRNTEKDKEYFAFGMKNEKGGYEIRTASDHYVFKSALNGRDITLISGLTSPATEVSLFEGMTDFLSLLALLKCTNLSGDSIIMHSLSSYDKTVEAITRKGYQRIHTFLDNNRAGQAATARLLQTFPATAISQSGLFAPHIDLNDALQADHRLNFNQFVS